MGGYPDEEFFAEMNRNLERVVLGELEGHMWGPNPDLPMHFYFGEPGEPIPGEKQPSPDSGFVYIGSIPRERAIEAIVAFANRDQS